MLCWWMIQCYQLPLVGYHQIVESLVDLIKVTVHGIACSVIILTYYSVAFVCDSDIVCGIYVIA